MLEYGQPELVIRRRQYAWSLIGCVILLGGVDFARADDGPPFPRIANVYGTTLTADGVRVSGERCALEDIARCDLLIGVHTAGKASAKRDLFRKQLAALKRVNPHLKALHFACSAPYTHLKPTDEMLARREPGKPFPWLLQTDAQLIAGWPGTYMLNLACPDVIEWLAQTAVPAVRTQGYDGVFIDCMGPHFDAWACEIVTGRKYTVDHDGDGKDDDRKELARLWAEAKTALAQRTRELLGDEPIFMANQADLALKEQLNGIYLEDYVDAVIEGRRDWETMLKLYLEWTHTPHQPNVTVLGCASGIEPPFQGHKLSAEKREAFFAKGRVKLARMRFGLATTLMGDGYYSYDLHTRWRGQLWWYPEYDAPLAYPKEDCKRSADGTWRRQFDGGVVIVNPTNWDVSVALKEDHRDVSSGGTGKQFVIPRQDGRIFVPIAATVATGKLDESTPLLTWEGPRAVVERDGTIVLRDGNGVAALLNQSGSVESFCLGGQELVSEIRSVIVHDSRWKDFAVEDCRHAVAADGTLVFKGTRSFDQQRLAFTETVRLAGGKLTVDYQWTAQTPLELQTFRQAVLLPPRLFGGASLRWNDGVVTLPKSVPDKPNLASKITNATLPITAERALTIRMSQSAQLLDDRFYRGSGYLLAFYPIAGKIAAGKTWSYSIEVAVTRPVK